jgi:hypothetical protein
MWFFIISSVAGSILGMAAEGWFADTRLGIWFYKKVDDILTWANNSLGLKILQEERKWKNKYPHIATDYTTMSDNIKILHKRIENLEALMLTSKPKRKKK